MQIRLLKTSLLASLLFSVAPVRAQDGDGSLLPFVSTDVVITRHSITGKAVHLSGVIENIAGNEVELRRAGGRRVDRVRLCDVAELRFRKSPEYDAGLNELARGNWAAARGSLEAAAAVESRSWVLREIHASTATTLLAIGQHEEVIQQIEKIVELDPDTRHVALLPLVWDERLPPVERYSARLEELQASSVLRRLAASSALLQDAQHEVAAVATLTELRNSGRPRIQELAEIQLWRVRLLKPGQLRKSDVTFWKSRAPDFDQQIRGGAEMIMGRAMMKQFDFDAAAVSLMWIPLMCAHDRPTAAASLREAATALRQSGRYTAAAQLEHELQIRFPETSAARETSSAAPKDTPGSKAPDGGTPVAKPVPASSTGP